MLTLKDFKRTIVIDYNVLGYVTTRYIGQFRNEWTLTTAPIIKMLHTNTLNKLNLLSNRSQISFA